MPVFTYTVCVALHKQGTPKFLLRPGGALQNYMAPRPFNLHLWTALLQFYFHSVLLLENKLFKNPATLMEKQKIVKTLAVY